MSSSLSQIPGSPLAFNLGSDDDGKADMVTAIVSASPYLANLMKREPETAAAMARGDPDQLIDVEIGRLKSEGRPEETNSAVSSRLRGAKRRVALIIALADLAGTRDLAWTTRRLSEFAAASVQSALAHLLWQAEARSEMVLTNPDDPARDCGIAILAMGKMGAFELNYSSDIDLIVLHDPTVIEWTGRRSLSDGLSRMIRALVQLMQERTADGYVFRTDLRLRPDPSVTPLSVSLEAALSYYESLAQNWERAAMIKARAAAGDIALGQTFLEHMEPFIWRRSLDFAAIADIQSIKRQIHAAKGHDQIVLAGHDIKLGRGGIREIEFFAQTQQLIAGGRDPRLRRSGTLEALDALQDTGRIEPDVKLEMAAAYVFLRHIEHRLQMLDDAQTQTLPGAGDGLDRLARFSGFPDRAAFGEALLGHMRRVADHYADLFAEQPSLAGPGGNLVFTGADDDPGTVETLSGLGYGAPASAIGIVKSWHAGRYRALRTTRARQILTDLVPEILAALGGTANPDSALAGFDRFLGRLPTGIQFMSLLSANRDLLGLLASIMGTAPALSEALSRNTGLLDTLLEPGNAPPDDVDDMQAQMQRELADIETYEDVLDAVRRFANDRKFDLGVALLTGQLDVDRVTMGLSHVAETAINTLLPRVEAEVARRHGGVPGASMAVIAMGKLGAAELTFGSDLDLVFVYDDAGEAKQSDGPSPLPIGPYFTRLSQRFISALTALTAEGMLYEVDMRLRPSGNKGAVAVPLSAYRRYMESEAWTWEFMAATRARVIAGDPDMVGRLRTTLEEIVCVERDVDALREAVRDMRGRIHKQHGTNDIWSIKHVRGGLVDIEFLVQFLILSRARDDGPGQGNMPKALATLTGSGVLAAETGEKLLHAYRILKNMQTVLRLCHNHAFDPDTASTDFKRLAARIGGGADFKAVQNDLVAAQNVVRNCFNETIGDIATN